MTGSRVAAVLLLPLALTGCAALSRATGADDDTPRVRVALARDPRAEAYYDFTASQLLVQAGRFKDAIPLLQEAIKRDPNSAFLWTQLAQWLIRADQSAEALTAAQRAVQLAPEDVGPHLTLAELLRAQKNFREAETELEKVIELSPANEDAYLTLARYQVEQKAYDRARAVLLRLAERQPRLAQAQFLLGRLAIETENWDEAIGRLTKAVELDPDHDGAWTALGYVYETRHQPEDAIKVYRKAMQANPDNPGFVERLSDLLIRLGRFNEAQSEVETLAEAAPRDARVWLKLGAVYYEPKMWERAADSFRRAVVLEPSNLRARYFLATSILHARSRADARGEL